MKIKRFNENNMDHAEHIRRGLEEGDTKNNVKLNQPDHTSAAPPPAIVPQGGSDCTVEHKEMLIKALSTLFFSWGGDTPSESFWAGNELLEWFEAQFQLQLNERFDEAAMHEGHDDNFEVVIEAIRNC